MSPSADEHKHEPKQGKLSWLQFTLFGVGCTMGTAFFLGSSIAIEKSGIYVLLTFLLVVIITYFIYAALAELTAEHPEKGSFRTYAKKAFGRWAGFSTGWLYWASEMLILGASLTALGLFSQFWFPSVPLWVYAGFYALLALIVVIIGSRGINKAEDFFAIIKIAAVLMFITIVVIALFRNPKQMDLSGQRMDEWLSPGWKGAWKGLLYAFYAFSGIEVMGFMAMNLRHPKEALKAGRVMLLAVGLLYIVSIGLALVYISPKDVTPDKSPLTLALEVTGTPFFVHLLNGVFIIAGFSILVASLYAVSTMLVTLSQDGDAPAKLADTVGKRKLPLYALGVNTLGLLVSIAMALWMPKSIFEHIVTAGGLVLLYNWLIIAASYLKLGKPSVWGRLRTWIAIGFILFAVSGTLMEPSSRPGFWASLGILLIVAVITLGMKHHWAAKESS
ncbi:transporter [Paenibacillus swuensis]|uniref:Transporter n=1 Tax=Paenibacillus swuensis TaxID=1178515 RepID=A0A172TEG0_9BACL|nr:amino acid permease [Paenibacillus swuensis]ANE45294.1 transporter [Paenibacillus swuensis]